MIRESLGYIVSGIGLFFVGMMMLKNSMMRILSERLQRLLVKWSRGFSASSFCGFVLGMASQNSATVSLIASNLVLNRGLSFNAAWPLITWANLGMCVLILLGTLSIHVATFFLLGFAAICLFFKRPFRLQYLLTALFGCCLALLGSEEFRQGIHMLLKENLGDTTSNTLVWGFFLCGVCLAFILRTFVSIIILAISALQLAFFTSQQALFFIYGAYLGFAIYNILLVPKLDLVSRRFVLFQVLYVSLLLLIFAPVFLLEPFMGGAELLFLVFRDMQLSKSLEIALLILIINGLMCVLLSWMYSLIHRWTEHWAGKFPARTCDSEKLYPQLLDLPESALALLLKDEERLMLRLPLLLGVEFQREYRRLDRNMQGLKYRSKHLSDRDLSLNNVHTLATVIDNLHLIHSIAHTILEIQELLSSTKKKGVAPGLCKNFSEALDFIVHLGCNFFVIHSEENRETLLNVTKDRSDLLQMIRNTYIDNEKELNLEDKTTILAITTVFERIVWLYRKLTFVHVEHPSDAL